MRENSVKTKLLTGERAFGTMIFEVTSPGLPAILRAAGCDYALYDMEHSGISLSEMRTQCALARGLGLAPIVRPPAKEYHYVSRLLDIGAMGVMLPMVASAEEAREIVSWTRYPPAGRRGAMFGGAHDDFLGGDIARKMAQADARTLVLAMIETEAGVAAVDEIAAVEGIDGLHLGQFDLSLSMGIAGQTDHPRIAEAVSAMLAAAERHGKFAACMAPSVELAEAWMLQGFRMISYSYDLGLIGGGLSAGLNRLRGEG